MNVVFFIRIEQQRVKACLLLVIAKFVQLKDMHTAAADMAAAESSPPSLSLLLTLLTAAAVCARYFR